MKLMAFQTRQALQAARETTWDATLGYNTISYQNYETNVYIWLEDEDSLNAKCELYSRYGIAGVAAWKLGQERPAMWDVIHSYY